MKVFEISAEDIHDFDLAVTLEHLVEQNVNERENVTRTGPGQ
jgi:hypothetical protein